MPELGTAPPLTAESIALVTLVWFAETLEVVVALELLETVPDYDETVLDDDEPVPVLPEDTVEEDGDELVPVPVDVLVVSAELSDTALRFRITSLAS